MSAPSEFVAASRYKELFGPFPVLSSEDPKRFETTLERVATALLPANFLEASFVYEYVCGSWEIYRCDRHQTLAIERRYRMLVKSCEEGLAREKARHEANIRTRAEDLAVTPPDIGHAIALEDRILAAVCDVDAILEATPKELGHNYAMMHATEFLNAVGRLRLAAIRRRNDALQLYEHYRQGLGPLLKKATEQAIAADRALEEQADSAPSIVPTLGEQQSSETQSSEAKSSETQSSEVESSNDQ
jgi:hypothetical protein